MSKSLQNRRLFKIIKAILLITLSTGIVAQGLNKKNQVIKDNDYLNNDLILVSSVNDSNNTGSNKINSILLFNSEIYFSNFNGIFKINEKNQQAIPFNSGIAKEGESNLGINKIFEFNNTLYAIRNEKGVYKLDSKTKNWSIFNAGLSENPEISDIIQCKKKLYLADYYLGIYVEKGNKWEKITDNKIKDITKCECIDSGILVANNANDIFFINSKDSVSNYYINLAPTPMESTGEGGETEGMVYINFGILDIKKSDKNIYVSSHTNGVFISKNQGISYETKILFGASFFTSIDGNILMGNYGRKEGLFVLDEINNSFYPLKLNINDVVSCGVCIGDYFYIGTNNSGVYKIKKSKISEIVNNSR